VLPTRRGREQTKFYGGLFKGVPSACEVIFTNPPFGGKENTRSITGFDYPTSATEVLFLQYIIRNLTPTGRCARGAVER
jgi:type I restriction enzyme M protein